MFAVVAAMTYAKRTSREFIGMVKNDPPEQYPENEGKTIMRNVKYIDIIVQPISKTPFVLQA